MYSVKKGCKSFPDVSALFPGIFCVVMLLTEVYRRKFPLFSDLAILFLSLLFGIILGLFGYNKYCWLIYCWNYLCIYLFSTIRIYYDRFHYGRFQSLQIWKNWGADFFFDEQHFNAQNSCYSFVKRTKIQKHIFLSWI